MTEPAGITVLAALLIGPTVSPAAAIAPDAADCVRLTTLGTVIIADPVDTTSATALLSATLVPEAGVWLITDPDGTVMLAAVVTEPTVRPALVMALLAAACVMLTTLGT